MSEMAAYFGAGATIMQQRPWISGAVMAIVLFAGLSHLFPGIHFGSHSPIEADDNHGRPWGPIATSLLLLLLIGIYLLAQLGVSAVYISVIQQQNPALSTTEIIRRTQNSGLLISIMISFAALVTIPATFLLVRVKKGIALQEYLDLHRVAPSVVAGWLGIIVLVIIVIDLAAVLLDEPLVPGFLIQQYRTARFLPLLYFALVVAAPLAEEIIFRGFALTGFLHSRLSTTGAVLLTALIWAIIHTQYDITRVIAIFLVGGIMGLSRLKTGSLIPAIAMHAFMNLVALVEVAIISGLR
jgi:hypothetical protein